MNIVGAITAYENPDYAPVLQNLIDQLGRYRGERAVGIIENQLIYNSIEKIKAQVHLPSRVFI